MAIFGYACKDFEVLRPKYALFEGGDEVAKEEECRDPYGRDSGEDGQSGARKGHQGPKREARST